MTPAASQRERMPEAQQRALRRAIVLSWLTIVYLAIDTVLLFLIKGNSQAMQAAWIQDLLALLPPLAFLFGTWVMARRATKRHPYGYHQSMDVAHFVSAVALLAFGGFLLVQSAMGLLTVDHPAIGLISMFGVDFWQGWLMIGFMALGVFPPVILGRMKIGPAKRLHNKVLLADSNMNKADWLSSAASILGVAGVGLGFWWADAIAAIIISLDILLDGWRNLRGALSSMTDVAPRALDGSGPHSLPAEVNAYLARLPWVKEVGCRAREEGQVLHIEAFVVLADPNRTPTRDLMEAREGCLEIDWKILDVVLVPVEELSSVVRTDTGGVHLLTDGEPAPASS